MISTTRVKHVSIGFELLACANHEIRAGKHIKITGLLAFDVEKYFMAVFKSFHLINISKVTATFSNYNY